ncbi:copper chaperone PCu(A)C [Methylobrevis albus]|uniref:Copper chaperone PCu(A)C n=1 Tax=Methylobrevis albus TaxID=2793297 RepID=A0A931I0M0_9HYPH|nr:copper chaperone PCu(A)C [Methylobrevis albus]MBH0237244.1 copper chaperone PCu(A)C [Methylobrevis albus]
MIRTTLSITSAALLLALAAAQPARAEEPAATPAPQRPTTAMPTMRGDIAEVPVEAPVSRFGAIEIVGPWARASLAGSRVGGAYFLIRNTGDSEVRLVTAETPVAQSATLRHMPVVDGVVRPVIVEGGIAVAAGDSVDLRPGSFNVMLHNLTTPLRPGSTFPLTLGFSDGTTAVVDVVVWDIGTMRVIAK